jgi:hypothetical protein
MGSSNFSSNDWESENHGVWGTLDLQGDGGTKVQRRERLVLPRAAACWTRLRDPGACSSPLIGGPRCGQQGLVGLLLLVPKPSLPDMEYSSRPSFVVSRSYEHVAGVRVAVKRVDCACPRQREQRRCPPSHQSTMKPSIFSPLVSFQPRLSSVTCTDLVQTAGVSGASLRSSFYMGS